MKQKKFVIRLCLLMALVLILPLISAHADTAPRSGSVTDSISWELTEEGILYIRGEGEIPDYGTIYVARKYQDNGPAPWEGVATEIQELVIEEGITRIGESAFGPTKELSPSYSFTKVTLPASLKSVGFEAFGEAYDIEAVYVPSLQDWCEIAFEALNPLYHFSNDSNPAFRANLYVGGELLTGKVIFPEGLTKVHDLTFAGRKGLTEVVLHEGVTELGNASFYESKELQFVNLPEGIGVIPYQAFARCSSLNGITLPQTVEKIEYAAFLKCAALETINIPAAVKEIETGAFVDCDALNAVHITDIDAWCHIVFEIPYGLHPHFSEGASPLHYAKNLYLNGELVKEVTVPEDITDLSDHAFAGCTSLQKVTLPEGLAVIGEGAFLGCTSLKEIRIPSTVKAVQGYAFDGCTSLERVYLESAFLIACKDYDEQHLDQWDEEFIYDEWGCCLRADVLIPEEYASGELGIIFATRTPEGVKDGYAVYGPCQHPETETKSQSHRCEEQVICLICGVIVEVNKVHANTSWVEVTPATYDAPGSKELRCTVCQTVLGAEAIPQLERPVEESSDDTSVEESAPEESSEPEEESIPEESAISEEESAPEEESSTPSVSTTESTEQSTSLPEEEGDGFPLWILFAAAGVIVLAIVGVILFKRRK